MENALFEILMWVLGVLQVLILGVVGVIWNKITSLEKKDTTISERVVAIETKLGNGIEATLQELKTLLVSHGEKIHRIEVALTGDASRYEGLERRLARLEKQGAGEG